MLQGLPFSTLPFMPHVEAAMPQSSPEHNPVHVFSSHLGGFMGHEQCKAENLTKSQCKFMKTIPEMCPASIAKPYCD